jgi:hypothetical protein
VRVQKLNSHEFSYEYFQFLNSHEFSYGHFSCCLPP